MKIVFQDHILSQFTIQLEEQIIIYVLDKIFQRIYKKVIVTNGEIIRDEKLQCAINRKTAKISGLSSFKVDKYKYLTEGEILPTYQSRMIEYAKFPYSALREAFKKQARKEVRALKS